jgi:hypothetical protein
MTRFDLGDVLLLLKRVSPDTPVYYDFCDLMPTQLRSWRGDYSQVALGWTHEGDPPSAGALARHFEESLGRMFEGYKGGGGLCHHTSGLMVANWAEAGNTAIFAVVREGGSVILKTRFEPDE